MAPAGSPSLSPFTEEHKNELAALLGEDGVWADLDHREAYGHDETEDLSFPPAVVVLPRSVEQTVAVLRLASREHLPVTPRGAGTGLSGGALPVAGGILLSLERLNSIRRIDLDDLIAEAEVGVVTGQLQEAVEEQGLYYPPDPGSRESCTIGGNLAEDAAGPHSCKYGSTRKFVLGLEAVLADGSIIRTGGANRKDATGYNLTQLLVGSEGTLAVITAATLRLLPLPKARLTLAIPFPGLRQAASAVAAIFREGGEPAACEILESAAMKAVAAETTVPDALLGAGATLMIELDGADPQSVLTQAEKLAESVSAFSAGESLVAEDPRDQRRLWALRSRVGEAVKHRSLYKEADTVVPRSRLANLVEEAHRIAAEHGLEAICYGHAADGNLHVNLLRGELALDAWERQRDEAESELFQAVVSLGGTITGEHGVGWTQRRHLGIALAPPLIELMRAVKRSFDPEGILNPDKIFPPVTRDQA